MSDELKQSLRESYNYCREHFNCQFGFGEFISHNDTVTVMVTHNGQQWHLISLYSKSEIDAVIEALKVAREGIAA